MDIYHLVKTVVEVKDETIHLTGVEELPIAFYIKKFGHYLLDDRLREGDYSWEVREHNLVLTMGEGSFICPHL